MKIRDIDKVNHLIGELNSMKALITHTQNADPGECPRAWAHVMLDPERLCILRLPDAA